MTSFTRPRATTALLFCTTVLLLSATTQQAHAGVPECHGLRLEDVASCELRASVNCTAGCDRLGIYTTSCATRLHTVCSSECTLSAMPTCTDSCTTGCQAECDAGVSVTCQHNCFGECRGSCGASCVGAADNARCIASCEATCDGECDIQCAPVVDAPCYTHCVECCGGSCTAQANMDCQTTCQDVRFEDCEREFQAECAASCDLTGALFCDDQYVMSGPEIRTCVDALAAQGITVHADATLTLGPDGLDTATSVCSVSERGRSRRGVGGSVPAALLGGVVLLLAWRRRRS